MKLPSLSPILKLNCEDVNLLVPELSIMSCSRTEDLLIGEKTEDADCESSLISQNEIQIDIPDDFVITSTPQEATDVMYADDVSEESSVKQFRTDSVHCLLQTPQTELNKTYSKTDLKELVECSSVKNKCPNEKMVRVRVKVNLMSNENQQNKKESTCCKNNKKSEKDPREENEVSKKICSVSLRKHDISCAKSVNCYGDYIASCNIFDSQINKPEDNISNLESSMFNFKTDKCGSNFKLYLVCSENVFYTFLMSCFLLSEVRIDFPYLFIRTNYTDILPNCSSTAINCNSKKLTNATQLLSNFDFKSLIDSSVHGKESTGDRSKAKQNQKVNKSKTKEKDASFKNKECRRRDFWDKQNIEFNNIQFKHSQTPIQKNTIANTSTSYDLLDGTTFSEYSTEQFWDYYGVEQFKKGSKSINSNDSLNFQCEKQDTDYLTYEMFVNELHNLTKQSNLSIDSLDTNSHCDNLSATWSGSSENNDNNDSCFEFIKKVPSDVKTPSANKLPTAESSEDLQYFYTRSISSKCAINKTQYINVRCVLSGF